ncbi:MAG: glycosyltransferase family 39 protein [Elusimicrobia bacterium]|nr:glycosyltransferase family 39 protein [Elusimicrobiota bacterium]
MVFRTPPKSALIAAVALGAAYVRLRGIWWGWPGVFDADAPHIVNLAVYFGSGDLNPHIFKYPTLWPYLLSGVYGAWFLIGWLAGLWHNASAFGAHFVWHNADFHVAARYFTAAVSLAGVLAVWRASEETGRRTVWAAAIAAFMPVLADMAHTPKADTILFLFSALSWHAALRMQREKTVRNAVWAGVWVGLAMSSQYTAAPLALLPVCAAFAGGTLEPGRFYGAFRLALVSAGCAFAALALTSPYIFLSPHEFLASLADMSRESALMRLAHPRVQVCGALGFNILFYAGTGSAAFLAALAGFARQWKISVPRALVFAVPCLAHILILANHPYGGWLRFLMPVLPAFILLSASALDELPDNPRPALAYLLALLVLGPGIWGSFSLARRYALPDTRLLAASWIEGNIRRGTGILLDQEHASPPLAMSRRQAEELLARTSAAGHPKKKYYQLMAQSHPGGGYRIYRIERSASDLESRPEHVKWSNSARDVLNVGAGLAGLEAGKIETVVLSSYGIDPARCPEYAPFIGQLQSQWRLAAEFRPGENMNGPALQIYTRKK